MKKTAMFATLAVAAFGFAATPAAAQTIGFKLGPTWATVDQEDDDSDAIDRLQSLGGGGFIRFGFMNLGMQAEVLAVSKGFEVTTGATESQTKIEYVEVPILARFGMGAGALAPYVMAGVTPAFKYSCDQETGALQTDCSNTVKKFDLGATGVAGLEFGMGGGHLFVEGRYTHGLLNIFEGTGDNDWKNRSFAAMAGYSFTMR